MIIAAVIVFTTLPLPFPLPVNFSFGVCGFDPSLLPGCATAMSLAPVVQVRCARADGCSSCDSPLFQGTFSRYAARLGGSTARHDPPPSKPVKAENIVEDGRQRTHWWRLNNTNCNLHDMTNLSCDGLSVAACQSKCEADPSCGGFLLYTKTNRMALKNATCVSDIAPLPPSDAGDDLFVLRAAPQPAPLPAHGGTLSTVDVCVVDPSQDLSSETDESYSLSIPAAAGPTTAALVKAQTVFGAMHGLETLTQLVDVSVSGGEKTIPATPVMIGDAPRFSFRGLMIDSGRHFLPIAHVKRTIEAAAMVKLNVIHWHLVDAQSFPSCSDAYPTLCTGGGYPNTFSAAGSPLPPNVSKATYSTAELRDVVAFAKTRGVRIMPEWDMPGHGSWGMGLPDLMTSHCSDALDVTRPALYDTLKAFLQEMGGIFTDKYLFLGGDELSVDCFEQSPSIAAWMKARGLNASGTQQYFWQQMTAKVFPSLNKTISVWRADSVDRGPYASNLPPGSVFNVYQSLATAFTETVPQGTPTVVSMAGESWYLDGECGGYNQNAWTCVYSFKGPNGSWLMDPTWSTAERALFLGGETAMWGEGINQDNFDAYVWRGAAAAAERLWATEESLGCPASVCPGISKVRPGRSFWMGVGDTRHAEQMCRMSRLGVRTGPNAPGFCPSDARTAGADGPSEEVEIRARLEQENAALRAEVEQLRSLGKRGKL